MRTRNALGGLASRSRALAAGIIPTVVTLAAAVLLLPGAASGQIGSAGNDFIVGFLNNYDGSATVELHLTSSVNMSVQVQYPYPTNLGAPVALTPGNVTIVSIPAAASNGWPTGGASGTLNAVRAFTVDPGEFTAYMINRKTLTSDAALALPVDSLGNFYRIITAEPSIAGGNQIFGSQFVVVATQNDTMVTITPSQNLFSGEQAGDPINLILDIGEGWLAVGTTNGAAGDLTGSTVDSTLPVTVTNGVGCVNIDEGACDHVFEVAQPVQTWGTGIPAANLPGFVPDGVRYRIMAADDDTTVLQDGIPISGVLSAGQFITTPRLTTDVIFDGDDAGSPKPIFVVQFMPGNAEGICAIGDPAIGNIIPAAQYQTAYTFSTVGGGQFLCNFVTIVAATADENSMTLDGNLVPGFTAIGGSGYSVARVEISSGAHQTVSTSGHGITVEGYNSFDSYLYPGGAALNPINVDLVLTKDDQVATCVSIGGTINYQVCYQNTGDDPANNVVIVDTLPHEVDFVSASGNGVYASGPHTVTWTVATAPADMPDPVCFDLTVTVNNTATTGGVIVNRASIDSDEADPTQVQEQTTVCSNQPPVPFCFGDGSAVACPCGNNGAAGHGCNNSANTGGAVLSASGANSVSGDSIVLTSSGELPNALTIFISGPIAIPHRNFGDGLRCTGGHLRRLYVKNAVGGVAMAPVGGDPSITARMAGFGVPIQAGETHLYQAYYRDPIEIFCFETRFNISSGLQILWAP